MAKNRVIAGDYEGKMVQSNFGLPTIVTGFGKIVSLDKANIENYEEITEEHRKSAASGVTRGLVGGALLGPVGLLAGLSAKSKGTHTVAIKFKDGKNSLLEVDSKIYKGIVKGCF